jgi:hypothetical protein
VVWQIDLLLGPCYASSDFLEAAFMRTPLLVTLVGVLLPASTMARNIDPGSMWLTGGLGGGAKTASPLGGSGGHFLILAQGEYAINKTFGLVGGVGVGLADTQPLRARMGARYRLADLGLPVSPWGQAQLSFGALFDVIGANLATVGVNLATGADYFLTASLSIGGQMGVDLASTLGPRPAFYGTVEILAVASYAWSAGPEAALLEEG